MTHQHEPQSTQVPPVASLAVATSGAPLGRGQRWFKWVLLVGAVLIVLVLFLEMSRNHVPAARIPLSRFEELLSSGQLRSVTIGSDQIIGELRQPVTRPKAPAVDHVVADLPAGTTGNWVFTQWLLRTRNGAEVNVGDQRLLLTIIVPLIPWLLIFGFIWFFVFRQLRKSGTWSAQRPLPVVVVNPEGR